MDELKGRVLFSTCCSSTNGAENIIKQLLNVDTLPESNTLIDDITAYSWTIDNKYYNAHVELCSCPRRTIGDRPFADSVQAIVLHFDANDKSSFDIVKAWLSFVELIDPSIRLLACDVCNDTTDVSFTTVQSWCIEHAFELVELLSDEDDEDEDVCDVVGVARIRSALEAHSWPNLTLKDTSNRSAFIENLMVHAADFTSTTPKHDTLNTHAQNGDVIKNCDEFSEPPTDELNNFSLSNDRVDRVTEIGDFRQSSDCRTEMQSTSIPDTAGRPEMDGTDEAELLAALGNDDPGSESFEIMFSRLKQMKDKADKLSDNERKAYAEKVALTFWRAVGGDENEIADLSDEDD